MPRTLSTNVPPSNPQWPQWMTRRETADYLRLIHGVRFGVGALANAATRCAGAGPPFSKDGGKSVTYWRPDVDEWARKRMRRVRSTSELRSPAPADDNDARPEAA